MFYVVYLLGVVATDPQSKGKTKGNQAETSAEDNDAGILSEDVHTHNNQQQQQVPEKTTAKKAKATTDLKEAATNATKKIKTSK